MGDIHILCSDEILLLNEAVDKIRLSAKKQGFLSRVQFDENTDIHSGSLFSEKEILECNITTKVSSTLQKAIEYYINHPPKDKLLIITAPKKPPAFLEKLKSKMNFNILWAIPPKQFPQWVQERLKNAGFTLNKTELELLCTHTDNNLLAVQQCIEKLKLLPSPPDILSVISQNSRYTVFDLANAIKEKSYAKIKSILDILKADGTEPPIVLWAIARECRLQKQYAYLPILSQIDDSIKGITRELIWPALERASFLIAGRKVL